MAQIWKPQTNEVHRHWVDTILKEASDKLSDWETKFIDDIDRKVTLGLQLTQAQEEKLESIYAEKTA